MVRGAYNKFMRVVLKIVIIICGFYLCTIIIMRLLF